MQSQCIQKVAHVVGVHVNNDLPPSSSSSPVEHADDSKPFGVWQSLCLSALYISTSIALFLSIRYCKKLEREGVLINDSTTIVMATELTKLLVSTLMKYMEDGVVLPYSVTFGPRRKELWRMSLLYAIPALLYALYNNLTYANLQHFDPGTLQIFMQTRIIFTGILFVTVLRRPLQLRKWVALGILTSGLVVKYFSPTLFEVVDAHVFLILLQAFFSSLAGVYNEYALKSESHLSIHQQNFFMYVYGILFNWALGLAVLPREYMRPHIILVPIIVMGALNGLTAAFILKFVNVIVKAFASAIEVLLIAVLAFALFGEPLTQQDLIAGLLVMYSVYLYSTNGFGNVTSVRPK